MVIIILKIHNWVIQNSRLPVVNLHVCDKVINTIVRHGAGRSKCIGGGSFSQVEGLEVTVDMHLIALK